MESRAKKRKTKRSPRRKERLALYESATFRRLARALASSIREARRRQGLTQERAAECCGLAARHVQRLEAATENVTLVTVARLIDGLGIDPRELFAADRR